MRNVIIVLAIALFFLHQDFWLWDDRTLVFGFLPIGLAYHTGFSIAASLLWAAASFLAWPRDVDNIEEEVLAENGEGGHP